jgi:hypothetical protein
MAGSTVCASWIDCPCRRAQKLHDAMSFLYDFFWEFFFYII